MVRDKFIVVRANEREVAQLKRLADHFKRSRAGVIRGLLKDLAAEIDREFSNNAEESPSAERALGVLP